jgi:hypothetical protein
VRCTTATSSAVDQPNIIAEQVDVRLPVHHEQCALEPALLGELL